MFAEILAAHLVLKAWKQNPAATKREIGVWQHWKEDHEENERPLSEAVCLECAAPKISSPNSKPKCLRNTNPHTSRTLAPFMVQSPF